MVLIAVAIKLNPTTDTRGHTHPVAAKPGIPNTQMAMSATANTAAFTSHSTHWGATTSRAHTLGLSEPGNVVGRANQRIQRHPPVRHVVFAQKYATPTLAELARQDI